MTIRPVGGRVVTCGHVDRRTDMMKLTVAIRNFANTPNMFLLNAQAWPNSEQEKKIVFNFYLFLLFIYIHIVAD